jgi:Ca-activated chloride channel family protein
MRSRLVALTAISSILATACGAMAPRATRMTYVADAPPPPPPMPAEVAAELAPPPAPPPAPVATPPAIAIATPVATAPIAAPPEAATGDTHAAYAPNPWVETERDRLSTFAADVDTASYTYSRRAIDGGALPPAAAVRVEEFVNAFPYAFGAPRKGSPFAVVMDAAPSPFVRGTTSCGSGSPRPASRSASARR